MDLKARGARFNTFVDGAGCLLGYSTRRALFAKYLIGLMSSLLRKTAEGVATLFSDQASAQAMHQSVQQFLADSTWEDTPIRKYVSEYALESLPAEEPVVHWIVDDTGFIKKGTHSVGVQRQYTGTSGKVDNCQLGVSLSLATRHRQLPLDFRLYLPRSWMENPERKKEAKIPDEIVFQTKPELAASMIQVAVKNGAPRGIVLADCAYGNNGPFRRTLRTNKLDYSVDILGSTKMWRADANGKRRGPVSSADSFARRVPFRRCTWNEGTKRELASRFGFARVVVEGDLEKTGDDVVPVWLGIERPFDDEEGTTYFLSTLPPTSTIIERVRTHKNRWRTERMYQDLKGVFGLDHYEGRFYRGWHHHITMAMAAYSFAFAEQARLFPPEAHRTAAGRTFRGPHRAPLPRLDANDGASQLWGTARMLATLSRLSPAHYRVS